jgi:phosphatidylglycerophosphate synthase
MLDRRVRALCEPALDAAGGRLAAWGISANALTGVGWACGVAACVAVGLGLWGAALAAWLANRALDGLDGALARRVGATDLGGFFDLVADFSVYAGFVVALAVALPGTRLASVALLFTYYLSGTALLGASAVLDRRALARRDERTIRFLGGLAEGVETALAYVVILVFPSVAAWVEWVFAAMVLVTAVQRIIAVRAALRAPRVAGAPPSDRVAA